MSPNKRDLKSNICILSECAWPDIGGGVTQALGLAKFLKSSGYPIFFLTQTKGLKLPKKDMVDSIPIYRVCSFNFRYGKYIMLIPCLFFLIKNRMKYDVIYVCGFRILGVLGVVVSKMFNKKCILKAESMGEYSGEIFKWGSGILQKSPFSKLSDIIMTFRNKILNKADIFIAINKIIEEEFYTHGVKKVKIRYIPNGVDRKVFYPVSKEQKNRLREKLNFPIDKKMAIYTGRLNKGKGLEMLLEVWKKLSVSNEGIGAYLIIAGSGSSQYLSIEDSLKQYVLENEMTDYVIFTGYVCNINEYLMLSDVLVLPSELEGLSCSIIEALACGIPVIATNVGGASEVIENEVNGLLIPPRVPEVLYEAIIKLICEKIKMKASLPEKFYMDNVFKSYNSLIQSL